MAKMALILGAAVWLAACAPSDQGDSGDSTFAPSNTTSGVVPDGVPNQGSGTSITDGETSTRGAVSATDAPTATQGKSTSNSGSNYDRTTDQP